MTGKNSINTAEKFEFGKENNGNLKMKTMEELLPDLPPDD